jgi:hypothetical protein
METVPIGTSFTYFRLRSHIVINSSRIGTLASTIALVGTLSTTQVVYADTVVSMNYLFSGRNIYAPTVIQDGGLYKMWYGGWQDNNQTTDKIYYRYSADGTNWSNPETVIVPEQNGAPSATHINDPSVTKFINGVNGQAQYTMFYTLCVSPYPCIEGSQERNELWSAVSNDGINWFYHQRLLDSGMGAAEPSAVVKLWPNGQFKQWNVYYVDRKDPIHQVKKIAVSGDREPIGAATSVYISSNNPSFALANPEVRYFNGKWHLFVNQYEDRSGDYPKYANILKAESLSPTWTDNSATPLITNGTQFCATLTPGVLPISGDTYALVFGLTSRSANGVCDFANNTTSIQRWIWRD